MFDKIVAYFKDMDKTAKIALGLFGVIMLVAVISNLV